VKISVSVPTVDVEFLDTYAHEHGIESRSAAVQRAIGLLRASQLGDAYEQAVAGVG
jgi:metal-responsive CopG/Arc/MetJ family transcriptional regulator